MVVPADIAIGLRLATALGVVCMLFAGAVPAREILVAVATNFTGVMTPLQRRFENTTAHRLTIASGSTGKLSAQITQGAPFDILLAADVRRPSQLVEQGYGVAGSRFT